MRTDIPANQLIANRQQAIQAGFLIDVSMDAQKLGLTFPVTVTKPLWEVGIAPDESISEEEKTQRLRDVLMAFPASHRQPSHTLAADRLSGHAGHAARWRATTSAVICPDPTGRTESRGGYPTAPKRSLCDDHSDELIRSYPTIVTGAVLVQCCQISHQSDPSQNTFY